jgi:cysteine-rich repeat protein
LGPSNPPGLDAIHFGSCQCAADGSVNDNQAVNIKYMQDSTSFTVRYEGKSCWSANCIASNDILVEITFNSDRTIDVAYEAHSRISDSTALFVMTNGRGQELLDIRPSAEGSTVRITLPHRFLSASSCSLWNTNSSCDGNKQVVNIPTSAASTPLIIRNSVESYDDIATGGNDKVVYLYFNSSDNFGTATFSASWKTEVSSACGDGLRDMGEACDDSNTDSGDGCSASCTVEDNFYCEGSFGNSLQSYPGVNTGPDYCVSTLVTNLNRQGSVRRELETEELGEVIRFRAGEEAEYAL